MTAGPIGLAEMQRLLAAEEATPLEILDQCLDRLDATQASGAFVTTDETGARRVARRLRPDPARPLHGIPVAIKDLVDVAGMPTALGRSRGRVAITDAPVVARLRAAGAVIIGKTRTDEIGLGTLTPGARDPRDPSRSVGGSSGGSAIAVAVGAAALAVATDTAGSARIPAAACGVTGLCPSGRWVKSAGVAALSPSCDRIGLIALGPADVEVAWRALGGARPQWDGHACMLTPDALGTVDRERLHAAAAAAHRLDADPVALTGPGLAAFGPPRAILVSAEAARRHNVKDVESPLARVQLQAGASYPDAAVNTARAELRALEGQLRAAIGNGVLVTPTLPGPPPRWDELCDVEAQLRATGRLTRLCGPVNTSGLVAISVPYGADAAGRAIGVQLVAAHEATVLAAALRLG
jgi:aspartyl-tRNA(Asn)/glutamyl-tRNA(Gln) amidotransferase subunit A